MKLSELGGEVEFLKRVLRTDALPSSVLIPNGDDAAVFEVGGKLIAVSTDAFVEGIHFSFEFSKPNQVGAKVIEASLSDIVAVGGKPNFVLISLCTPKETDISLLDSLYEGVYAACKRCNSVLLGGDLTASPNKITISITAIGEVVSKKNLCPRSGAKPDDLIFVTGPLGTSHAGFRALEKNISGFEEIKTAHQSPKCRVDIIDKIAPIATSMIDISDGLSSEISHIAAASNCGAVIYEREIPILPEVKQVAALLNENPYDYAWSGGEDYELLYTVPEGHAAQAVGTKIGVVTGEEVLVERSDKREKIIATGFDHYR